MASIVSTTRAKQYYLTVFRSLWPEIYMPEVQHDFAISILLFLWLVKYSLLDIQIHENIIKYKIYTLLTNKVGQY